MHTPVPPPVTSRLSQLVAVAARSIKAMGGRLEIRAVFPNGIVRIGQFQDLRKRA